MRPPPWLVLHLPHDSTEVPGPVRSQFVMSDAQLARELDGMTDHHTLALFGALALPAQTVRAPVSRLVVDVERFASDDDEAMAARGMGAVYTTASDLQPLRRPLSAVEREDLMRTYYWPHHERFDAAVTAALENHGRCLVIDGHSFAAQALPYELELTPFDGHLMVQTEGVRDEQIPNGVRARVSSATCRTGARWAQRQRCGQRVRPARHDCGQVGAPEPNGRTSGSAAAQKHCPAGSAQCG